MRYIERLEDDMFIEFVYSTNHSVQYTYIYIYIYSVFKKCFTVIGHMSAT